MDNQEARRLLDTHRERVNASDIELASDVAWDETIKPDCECGTDQREECRCPRTEEFKERAEEIRERWFGPYWGNSLKLVQNLSGSRYQREES